MFLYMRCAGTRQKVCLKQDSVISGLVLTELYCILLCFLNYTYILQTVIYETSTTMNQLDSVIILRHTNSQTNLLLIYKTQKRSQIKKVWLKQNLERIKLNYIEKTKTSEEAF